MSRGPRDHLRIAAIGDGEPVALGGGGVSKVGEREVGVLGDGEGENGKEGGSQGKVVGAMGGGKKMGKWKWKRELELERKGKGKVQVVEEVTTADVGDVDLLSFSD